jgi:hypothetical protein
VRNLNYGRFGHNASPNAPLSTPRRALRLVQRYNISRSRDRHIGEKSCLGRARIAEDEWDFVCPEETLNQFRRRANCRRECHKVDYNTRPPLAPIPRLPSKRWRRHNSVRGHVERFTTTSLPEEGCVLAGRAKGLRRKRQETDISAILPRMLDGRPLVVASSTAGAPP